MYAAPNHCSWLVEASNSVASVGSATLSTVASSPIVSMERASAASAHQRPLILVVCTFWVIDLFYTMTHVTSNRPLREEQLRAA